MDVVQIGSKFIASYKIKQNWTVDWLKAHRRSPKTKISSPSTSQTDRPLVRITHRTAAHRLPAMVALIQFHHRTHHCTRQPRLVGLQLDSTPPVPRYLIITSRTVPDVLTIPKIRSTCLQLASDKCHPVLLAFLSLECLYLRFHHFHHWRQPRVSFSIIRLYHYSKASRIYQNYTIMIWSQIMLRPTSLVSCRCTHSTRF